MTIHAFAGLGDDAAPPPPDLPRPDGPIAMPGSSGQMDEGVSLFTTYALMGLRGLGGYLVGQAIAPTARDRTTYGVIGAACGSTLGVVALGVFAAIAHSKRDGR